MELKTLGQIAFEEFESKLASEFGFTDRLGWEHLTSEFKVAWESAASLIERLTFEEYESK